MTKIKTLEELKQIVDNLRNQDKKVVWTNGCFDILHAGHIQYLREAKALGDVLIIGLNSDISPYFENKPGRPLMNQNDRAELLAALEMVDYVIFYDDLLPSKMIQEIKPDIHVKAGDWKKENMPETKIVESYGGEVVIIPTVEGKSTTDLINKIINAYKDKDIKEFENKFK